MKTYFFCGIGGIGMSGLARFLQGKGNEIMGSDNTDTVLLDELEAEKMKIYRKQAAGNITKEIEEFIYTEAIAEDHPEKIQARTMGIPVKSYFEKLGEVSAEYFTIAIAGTHGKSTTTAMAGLALQNGGARPNVIVGTKIFEWENRNFAMGESNLLVVEACEYRESFLHLRPNIIVLTSLEPEHLDYYKTPDRYFEGYRKFLTKLPPDGIVIADSNDSEMQKLLETVGAEKIDSANFLADVPELKIPGEHNRQNAAHVLALFSALHLPAEQAQDALREFRGSWRRFEIKGERDGVEVIDDYGHHPTEIKVTLAALKEAYEDRKKWIVFQPHQYSRTAEFLEEFATAFTDADEILIPNIYAVRDSEADRERVTPEILVDEIAAHLDHDQEVRYTENFENTVMVLHNETRPGDVVLTIGAGPVHEVGEMFLEG